MPLYEFECASCQKVIEVMQKFSDAPLAECPDCKGPVTKLVSMSSFALKGTGWYTTDYKKKSMPAPVEKAEKKSDAPLAAATSTAPSAAPIAATPASTSSGGTKTS